MLPSTAPTRPKRLPSPAPSMSLIPSGGADGAVINHAGRYAREIVLLAFEMIGGVERMASWADANPGEFYTRLFTKVITKEVEVTASQGIEDLLHKLDAAPHVRTLPSESVHSHADHPRHHSPEPQEAEYDILPREDE